MGNVATWVVPSVIGLYNVSQAPPELRMRTLFEEGFGVVGGYLGTISGAEIVGLGIVSILCLGPFGMFITVFICATAGGLIGSELLKGVGGKIYDHFEPQFDTGRIYHSPEQLFLEAAK